MIIQQQSLSIYIAYIYKSKRLLITFYINCKLFIYFVTPINIQVPVYILVCALCKITSPATIEV